jgi:hypothetical protein
MPRVYDKPVSVAVVALALFFSAVVPLGANDALFPRDLGK